jgi:uncharacterized protein
MERLWLEAESVGSTRLLVVELRAALGRAVRMKRLTPRGLVVAKRALASIVASVALIEVGEAVIASAADLVERHGLRAYDAVHLASAIALADPEVVVATWDADLRRAAAVEGLAIAT